MSVYRVHLSDGTVATVESDHEPTQAEIFGAMGHSAPEEPADFSDVKGGSGSSAALPPGSPVPGAMGYPDPLSTIGGIVKGAGKSAVNTASGLGMLVPRLLGAMGVKGVEPAIGYADALHKELAPQNNAEEIGRFGEQMAENLVPAGKLGRAMEGAPLAARMLAQGARQGVTSAAQTSDLTSGAAGATSGGLGEAIGDIAPAVLRSSAVKNWMKILQRAGLNPFQRTALKEALTTAADELPVGAAPALVAKTAGAADQAGAAVEKAYTRVGNRPLDLSEAMDNLTKSVEAPANAGGRVIKPAVKEVRFNDLSPVAQDHHLENITQLVSPGTSFSQLPAQIQSAVRTQAANLNDVIIPGEAEILDSPAAAAAQRAVTQRVGKVADLTPAPTVWQGRALKQGLNEDASKALEQGVVTPQGEALKQAGGEVAGAIHDQYPQLKNPDATYHTWKTIADKTQAALGGGDPAKVSGFSKYFAAKMAIGATVGAASGEAEGGHKGAAMGSLAAMGAVALGETAFWNTLSAGAKNSIAAMIEQGDRDGAAAALRSAALIYAARQRSNRKALLQNQVEQLQRGGATE